MFYYRTFIIVYYDYMIKVIIDAVHLSFFFVAAKSGVTM